MASNSNSNSNISMCARLDWSLSCRAFFVLNSQRVPRTVQVCCFSQRGGVVGASGGFAQNFSGVLFLPGRACPELLLAVFFMRSYLVIYLSTLALIFNFGLEKSVPLHTYIYKYIFLVQHCFSSEGGLAGCCLLLCNVCLLYSSNSERVSKSETSSQSCITRHVKQT